MLKPICVSCGRFYRQKKSGVFFIESMPKHSDAPSGTESPDSWKPYKLWSGDLWECDGCGKQIIVDVPARPIAEHYQPDFDELCRRFTPSFTVNDC